MRYITFTFFPMLVGYALLFFGMYRYEQSRLHVGDAVTYMTGADDINYARVVHVAHETGMATVVKTSGRGHWVFDTNVVNLYKVIKGADKVEPSYQKAWDLYQGDGPPPRRRFFVHR